MPVSARLMAPLVAALFASLLWVLLHRPVELDVSWSQPLASVSFAPFRDGQSPLTKTYPSRAQIDEDLGRLRGLSRGVRTYTSREGMEAVPELAAKHGLSVTHSAWLGTRLDYNEAEITALIDAARRHPGSIGRVIVGNEVLLRRDLTARQLIGYLDRVRAAIDQPVSYADVWAFWLKNPELAEHVDYITIHILPYWEDEPAPVDAMQGHIQAVLDRVRAAFPNKPILIGEAGWPTEGRNRGPAVAGIVEAARFVRALPAMAHRMDVDYNVVEAFDQNWKSRLEGTVGARWGILDIDRQPRFPLSGPVPARSGWHWQALASVLTGLAATAVALHRQTLPTLPTWLLAGVAQVLAACLVIGASAAVRLAFGPLAEVWGGLRAGLLLLTCALLALAWNRQHPLQASARRQAGRLFALYAIAAVVAAWLLAADGRYRDIPVVDFLLPVFGVALWRLADLHISGQAVWSTAAWRADALFDRPLLPARAVQVLALLLPMMAVAVLLAEGFAIVGEDFSRTHTTLAEQAPLVLAAIPSNRETNLWAAMLLLFAVPWWLQHRHNLATLR